MAEPFNDTDPVRKTFFINASERDTDNPENDEGKVPQLEGNGKLHSSFINFEEHTTVEVGSGEAMDGTTQPIAVFLKSEGNVYKSDADASARQGFTGFVSANISQANVADFLNELSATGESISGFVANAGEQRAVFVVVFSRGSASTVPAGVTYDGNAMTFVESQTHGGGTLAVSVWSYVIGSNDAADAAVDIVASSFTGVTYKGIAAFVYENVSQEAPVGNKNKNTSSSTSSVTVNLTPLNPNSRVLSAHNASAQWSHYSGGQTERASLATDTCKVGDVINATGASANYGHVSHVSTHHVAVAIEVQSGTKQKNRIVVSNLVTGFAGLVRGATYYVSDTAGEISTTPGTQSIRVGKAVSSTELLITH